MKIHIAVNVKTKKLDKKITIGELFADDGASEGNDIFRCLGDNGIMPCIKVRKNARVGWKKREHL